MERPASPKFARPILILPELFTTKSHLSLLIGYLASIGWEVYGADLYQPSGKAPGFAGMLASARAAVDAIGREVIVMGHGFGGLIALRLASMAGVTAAVALAPAIPGFQSPLFTSTRNRLARRFGARLRPPAGRVLFELVADADRFQRDTIIMTLRPAAPAAPFEIALTADISAGAGMEAGESAAPRLIIVGEADPFAPLDRTRMLAQSFDAELSTIAGRGHWLIGGRALERAVNETQRFLVKKLGSELLLLYGDTPDQSPDDPVG